MRGFFCRVGHGVDTLQLTDADLGINLGRVQVGMSEHLLDKPDVGTIFEHERGARMPEQMTAAVGDSGLPHVLGHDPGKIVRAQARIPVAGKEKRLLPGIGEHVRANVPHVFAHPRERSPADGNNAVFLALALPDEQHPTIGFQVAQFEPHDFHSTDPARIEGFQNSTVTDVQGRADVGQRKNPLNLRFGKDTAGKPPLIAGHFQFACRVVKDDILTAKPSEVILDGNQPLPLRAHAKRVSVRLAVPEHGPLVAFQNGPRHILRPVKLAVLTPANEGDEGQPSSVGCQGRVIFHGQGFEVILI